MWRSAAGAACAAGAADAADGHSAWEGSQKLKISAEKISAHELVSKVQVSKVLKSISAIKFSKFLI